MRGGLAGGGDSLPREASRLMAFLLSWVAVSHTADCRSAPLTSPEPLSTTGWDWHSLKLDVPRNRMRRLALCCLQT